MLNIAGLKLRAQLRRTLANVGELATGLGYNVHRTRDTNGQRSPLTVATEHGAAMRSVAANVS